MFITDKHCPCNGKGAYHDRDNLVICSCPVHGETLSVEGTVDPETGAGVEALVRRLVDKLGRAGKLPLAAQREFDARRRS